MARKGIVVDFVANVREFLRGTDDVERSLDDVADSLDDVAREGEDATRDLERDIKDLARDSERSFKEIARDARKSFDDVGDAGKRGFKKVEDSSESAGQVISDEARQSSAELGASFDGSFESIVDGFRDVSSAAGTELGGVAGYALGFGTAIGIGLITKIVEGINEGKERVRAGADALFGSITAAAEESGRSAARILTEGLLDEAAKQERLMDVLGVDNITDALVEVNRIAGAVGASSGDIYDALTGTAEDTARVLGQVETNVDRLEGKARRGDARSAAAAEDAITAQNKLNKAAGYKADTEERAATAVRTQAQIEGQAIADKQESAALAERNAVAAEKAAAANERSAAAAKQARSYWRDIERDVLLTANNADRIAAPGQVRAERTPPR